MILETPRLILRPFEERDILPFSAYRSDPEVAKYQGWEAPYSIEQASRFVAEMKRQTLGEPGHWVQLAIVSKTSAEMLGDIAFKRLENDHAQAEIGFTLARNAQGNGYALEAVVRLFAYLFDDLSLHRVFANCDPENLSSARLMQRAGMRHEGRFIDSLWYKGRWASEDWYAILSWEWENHRK